MAFLQACADREAQRVRDQENAIAEQAKQKQQARYRMIILAISIAAALGALGLALRRPPPLVERTGPWRRDKRRGGGIGRAATGTY